MISRNLFYALCLVWFFGWGILATRFPAQCYRFLSWGREPSSRNLRLAKIVGYMGLGFGLLLVVEIVFGLLR